MKKKSAYEKAAKSIKAANINGVSAKNAEAGTYIFKALGEVTPVEGTTTSWMPVYLENKETGELARFSAKSVIQAKGLKFESALGADRLASVDKACADHLEVEFEGTDEISVNPRAGLKKGDNGWFEAYKRYTLNFEPVDMPSPEYAEE